MACVSWASKPQFAQSTSRRGQLRQKCWSGSTEIWTRIAGFRVLSANHYTIEPRTCRLCHWMGKYLSLATFSAKIISPLGKRRKKRRARPGFEPGTSRTLSENHTPRPKSQLSKGFYKALTKKTTWLLFGLACETVSISHHRKLFYTKVTSGKKIKDMYLALQCVCILRKRTH